MKWVSYLLALFLLVLALLVSLPFSGPGSRWLLNRADSLPFVEVGYEAGRLLGELRLSHFRVLTDGVAVSLERIRLELEFDCLVRSEFCFSQLEVGELLVEVRDSAETPQAPAAETGAAELIELPFPVRSDNLRLDRARVTWPGGHWEQGQMEGAASYVGTRLRVGRAELASGALVIESSQSEAAYAGFEPGVISLPLELEVVEARLAQAVVELAGWSAQVQGLALAGEWRGARLSLPELRAAQFRADPLDLQDVEARGQLEFSGQWPLQLDLRAHSNAAEGALADREFSVRASGDFSALQLQLASGGEPEVAASATLEIVSPGLPLALQGTARWPEGSSLAALWADAPAELARLQLEAPVALAVQGDLQSQQLSVQTRASGAGYQSLQLQGRAQSSGSELRIDSLALSDAASDSSLAFSGRARLAADWALDGELSSAGLALPAQLLPGAGRLRGKAVLSAGGAESAWEVRLSAVDLQGEFKGMPARLQGYAGIGDGARLLPADLRGELNGASFILQRDPTAGTPDRIAVSVDEFGRWQAGARGSLRLQGQGDLLRGPLALGGEALNVKLQDLDLPRASVEGVWRRDAISELRLEAPELGYLDRRLEQLALELRGTAADHRIALSVAGELQTGITVHGSFGEPGWRGELAPLELATPSGAWRLDAPVALDWQSASRVLTVAAHCWHHAAFELCAQQARVGAAGDLAMRLEGDISAFNGLLPPDLRVQGDLDSDFSASWGGGRQLQLAAQTRASAVEITRVFGLGESATMAWDLAEVDIQRGADRLIHVNGGIERAGRRVVVVSATLPPEASAPMAGRMTLDRLQLNALTPWASLFADFGGEVSGQLQLGGDWESPEVRGRMQLAGGHALLEGNPTALTELDLDLQLTGSGGRLDGAGLLGGGPVRLAGSFGWEQGLAFDLAVEGEKQRILLPPASELLVSEQLRLVYSANTLDLSGDIRVVEGLLRHEELPEGSVALSPDVVEVDTAGNVIHETEAFRLRTDLRLQIDDGFEVRGDNLQATLGGALHLKQEPAAPAQVFGSLGISGGELRAYRQRLEVKRGTVDFSGPVNNPVLDVTAERRIRADNVTVSARLFGPLESPQLEIFSDPPMSQGEAMSYLVRGRGLDSGANADGAALALAVGADVVNQSGIVRGLNRLPFIHDLAFGASGEEDDTAATVGGYLGDRIYLSYGLGLYEPINEFTARLYLQSRLWLEVVSRLENSVDLYYSFDID